MQRPPWSGEEPAAPAWGRPTDDAAAAAVERTAGRLAIGAGFAAWLAASVDRQSIKDLENVSDRP